MGRPANINKSRPVSSAIVPKPDEQPHQKMEGVNIRKMLSVVSLKPSPKSKVPVNSSHQLVVNAIRCIYLVHLFY